MPNQTIPRCLTYSTSLLRAVEVDDLCKRVCRACRASAYGFFQSKFWGLSDSGDRLSWFIIVLVNRTSFGFTTPICRWFAATATSNFLWLPINRRTQTQTRIINFHYANEFYFCISWRLVVRPQTTVCASSTCNNTPSHRAIANGVWTHKYMPAWN